MALVPTMGLAWEISAQAGLTTSDNLSRTSYRPYRQTGETYIASVSLLQSLQLTGDWLLVASADVGEELVPKFTALDTTKAGLHLLLRHKFGLGPLAPVLDLSTSQTINSVRESGRSGWNSEADVTLRKRLTETLRVTASGGWAEYYASHHPFDVRDHHGSVEVAWDFTDSLQLTAGAKRLWGRSPPMRNGMSGGRPYPAVSDRESRITTTAPPGRLPTPSGKAGSRTG
jgi:hypothetical protein